ncbi:hypothetical protein Ahia01_000539000 [Argonauta hians]
MDMDLDSYYSDDVENMDEEDLLSYYEAAEDMYGAAYDDMVYPHSPPLSQLMVTCALPVIQQTVSTVLPLAVACFVSRLVASLTAEGFSDTPVQKYVVHITSCLFGLSLLYNFFQTTMVYLYVTSTTSYLLLVLASHTRWRHASGIFVSVAVVAIIITLELFIVDSASWHKIRGSQMIMSMKIISLAFDVSSSSSSNNNSGSSNSSNNSTSSCSNNSNGSSSSSSSSSNNSSSNNSNSSSSSNNSSSNNSNSSSSSSNNTTTNTDNPVTGSNSSNTSNSSSSNSSSSNSSETTTTTTTTPVPDLWEYHGYVFNVGTVIFGPWISYNHYCTITTQHNMRPMSIQWLYKLFKCTVSALLCLVVSTCGATWLIQDHYWKWLTAYRDAMSFRFSHYFVSYVSTLTLTLNGLGATTHSDGQVAWDHAVSHPSAIELPRSLVETVSNWNLPMHHWLKNYVFKIARHPFGNFGAVLLTYAASSLLHGLNFQLAAVLLSLAFYTYIEYVFRRKLARIFDACLLAKKCKDNCSHSVKATHPCVMLTNLLFGLLAMFHLAYLGLMFDSSSQEEKGYDMHHTLSKWSSLDYLSHWSALGTFLFHLLI